MFSEFILGYTSSSQINNYSLLVNSPFKIMLNQFLTEQICQPQKIELNWNQDFSFNIELK